MAATAAGRTHPAGASAWCPNPQATNWQYCIYDKMHGLGAHEVIIETPDHQSTLATLPDRAVEDVLWSYRDRVLDLKNDKRFRYVLIFKNHGEVAGASLEHSHSQLIALPIVPRRVREEVNGAKAYFRDKERCISGDGIRCPGHQRERPVHRRGSLRAPLSV